MTEAQWLSCSRLATMVQFLAQPSSERKPRLAACAWMRDVWESLKWKASREAVEVSERFADGCATPQELQDAAAQALVTANRVVQAEREGKVSQGERGVARAAHATCTRVIRLVWPEVLTLLKSSFRRSGWHYRRWEELLRDIFGNPFRIPRIDPAWQIWNEATIPRLAQAIYDERAFDRLPILADALEEAGCTDAVILAHCRQPGEHVRGCWVVDLLLGKS